MMGTKYRLRGTRVASAVALAGLVMLQSACSNGETGSSDGPGANDYKVVSTKVDAVAALVPPEWKKEAIPTAIFNNYPPALYEEDGKPVGWVVEYVEELAAVMDVKLDLKSVSNYDAILPGLGSGRFALAPANYIVTADRLNQVDMVTMTKAGTQFAAGPDSELKIENVSDICGLKIATLKGSAYIEQIDALQADCGDKPIELQTYPDNSAGTQALLTGRVDLYADSTDSIGYQATQLGDKFVPQSLIVAEGVEAIALMKGSPLTEALHAAIEETMTSGVYSDLLKKYNLDTKVIDTSEVNPSPAA